MNSETSTTSKKSTRPSWLKPGEVWGGDGNDNPEIGDTVGLRVKRWYRGLSFRDERQEAYGNVIGSKITLRKIMLVFLTTLTVYHFSYLAFAHAGMGTKVSTFVDLASKLSH